jgi:hypothetical protein
VIRTSRHASSLLRTVVVDGRGRVVAFTAKGAVIASFVVTE